MRLAVDEYDRFVAQLRTLGADDWSEPTACEAWDVHPMACHALGMAELVASPFEQMRQTRAARRRGGLFIDALTALQVGTHVHRTPADIPERIAAATRRAEKGRARLPSFVRGPEHRRAAHRDEKGAHTEPWTIGCMSDVVLTRDRWIHRSDVALATGRAMSLAADHDGVLVEYVAAERAERHGSPCTLALTGPAGGTWMWARVAPPTSSTPSASAASCPAAPRGRAC